MKKFKHSVLTMVASLAFVSAFSIFGQICSTWFGQEKTPQCLADLEL